MRPSSLATAFDQVLTRPGATASLILRYLIVWATQALVLLAMAGIFVTISVDGLWDAFIVIVVAAGFSASVMPVLIRYAVRLRPILFPIISFVLNAWVLLLLTFALPGWEIANWMSAGLTAAALTAVGALMGSFLSISDDAAWRNYALGPMRARYRDNGVIRTDEPGYVFLEIDGLSEPVLREAIEAGYAPHLDAWLKQGTHRLVPWTTDLSSQTSASQAGILLGSNVGIPAFRWFDRALGRVVVSNRTRDAAMLQQMLSTGAGLLADGGASRGNLFSGDAPDSLFTFSTVMQNSGQNTNQYYLFYSNLYNLARTIALFISDVCREVVAATWQLLRNERPRIRRFGVYPLVRAATTSILRELNTFTIAGDMLRGVPAMYTTYLAYDEVAHHSGITRGDALRVLRQIDRDVGRLERVAAEAPRPYHLIVLSDHGQTQGATFRQRYGTSLANVVQDAMNVDGTDRLPQVIQPEETTDEGADMLTALVRDFLARDADDHPVVRRALSRRVGTDAVQELDEEAQNQVVVLASGNLGLVSFTEAPRRLTLEEMTALHPQLIPSLAEHPGIGFVMVETNDRGPLVVGDGGFHALRTGEIGGNDPLARYGPHAPELLLQSSTYVNAPDILIMSEWWEAEQEVAAFEELVGSHGGLGGPQAEAFLLSPVELPVPDAPIVGAEALHRVLKGWVVGEAVAIEEAAGDD